MLPQIFFGYFAISIIVLSLLTVTGKNLVHNIMWMLLLFLNIACLYLFLNAEFIAAIQIIVYAGAILVLFLFVVMLLNLKEEIQIRRFMRQWRARLLVSASFLAVLAIAFQSLVLAPQGKYSIQYIQKEGHTKTLGTVLYNEFSFPFMIFALVLFVPMIAAIVLAIKRKKVE